MTSVQGDPMFSAGLCAGTSFVDETGALSMSAQACGTIYSTTV